ncbi:SWIM zinc finger domain-containing protein [Azovibrio restrictus]|uniref:SWIM zinc finger family protein n=1 Tax=Azovibrio restrictus TaxID=146938 RepID=UPI0026EB6E92|nr:SWIM zinc finger family protein [Azovibrio restrictus]MDD3482714.1 SWIM zinc finger family protein [Azovibrio restrictus]
MMQLSASEILQLSPDDASAKAAKGLVVPGKWPRLEYDERAIWGECQGSGSKPYQVQFDKSGPAFRCTCPSRKFPCKHGLALLLLMAQNPTNFSAAEAPAWVTEWLASRQQRAEKQEARIAEKRDAPVDPQASARREDARRQRMATGMEELERWLTDRLRQGLAQLPGQAAIWEEMARRMVDAQAPGLAFRLRQIGARVGQDENWPGYVLGGLGQLRVLIDAFRRLDSLPLAVQQDVRAALGLAVDRDSVLATGERLRDDWLVLGQSIDEDGNLWSRRVWLFGRQSGRTALLLDFAHGNRRFEQNYVTASNLNGELAFFPGNLPLRALGTGDMQLLPVSPETRADSTANPKKGPNLTALPTGQLDTALTALAQAVAANPWQSPLPMMLEGVPYLSQRGWSLHCPEQRRLTLRLRDEDGWQLLAASGGAPLTVFGEWNGEVLRPLAAWQDKLLWQETAENA